MRLLSFYVFILIIISSCKGKNIPNVSAIKVDLQIQRFDKDFFSIDTNHTDQSLAQLHQKYPLFIQDFIFNILALSSQPDSSEGL